ncbi:MAG: hypothetical protein E6417_03850, partial [Bradyrhizobium sp.]|nr:hypothetical protein [Bradyrhizobium sp.]
MSFCRAVINKLFARKLVRRKKARIAVRALFAPSHRSVAMRLDEAGAYRADGGTSARDRVAVTARLRRP